MRAVSRDHLFEPPAVRGGGRGSRFVNKRQRRQQPRTKTAAMPRFPDSSVACLKRTMLARQPHFMFTTSDVQNVMKETGLDKAQVQDWADNLRYRFKIRTLDDTMIFLRSTEKVRDHLPSCVSRNIFSTLGFS